MIHLGDITKIHGWDVPFVDCIIGGSPCQDLSTAGKRQGLSGARSGLFMDQIRVVKEMRNESKRSGQGTIKPRFMVWENVPGAFSSNKGEDFRAVLEEVARISEGTVSIPRPANGKWTTSGVIIGNTFSIAWRVFDAKDWGVPQRRRRICLVADFDGHSAADIVFDKQYGDAEHSCDKSSFGDFGEEYRSKIQSFCESLSRDSEQSRETREETSADVKQGSESGYPSFTMQDREGCSGGGQRIPDPRGIGYIPSV